MAGPIPRIKSGDGHDEKIIPARVRRLHTRRMSGWVYIMADRKHGVNYVGVTSDLIRRVMQHKDGSFKGFTHKYSVHRLVYFEQHATAPLAIQREKNIKHWPRAWKVRLIHQENPEWIDLYETLLG